MSNSAKKQSSETVPVHFPRPGERYVRVEDLVSNAGVREQIDSMAKMARERARDVASNKRS